MQRENEQKSYLEYCGHTGQLSGNQQGQHGIEAVSSTEVAEKIVRTKGQLKPLNDQMLLEMLDESEEKREAAQ